jgi:FkbM family methyltransferase
MVIDKILTPFLRLPHFKGKTRIEELLRRLLWTPHGTIVAHGIRMELDPAEWIQMQLLKRNWIEPRTLELYAELLRSGDVFVDVGAHVGFHSLVARQLVGSEGLVMCVEPQAYNAQKILANWRVNNYTNLKLVVGAASDHDGWVELSDQYLTDRSLLTLRDSGGKNEAQRFEVPCTRLDTVLRRHEIDRVCVLKIDVEGYELEVMRGVGNSFGQIDNIIVEVLSSRSDEGRLESLIDLFRHNGYALYSVADQPWKIGDDLPENNLWARKSL